MIHSTIPSSSAKALYGLIFGMGTLGTILGSFLSGFFAVEIGSEQLLFATLPLYIVLMFAYKMAFQRSGVKPESFKEDLSQNTGAGEGFALIRRSPFLISILLLVVFMQVSVGLVEYLFNAHLELNVVDKDLRTEVYGRLIGLTNLVSALFQFIGGFLLIQFLGVRRSHFFIPLFLSATGIVSWFMPTFGIAMCSFVFVKSVDFSLFGILREMLYVPLKLDEKFRAKAVIDVFAYRTSKAAVSLCVLGLQAIAGPLLLTCVSAFFEIRIFMSQPLFGNYEKYYRVTQEFPIDCLRSLKKGEMVIKQGSQPNRYVAIFHDVEGLPYIKIVEAVGNVFRSGLSLYPTFENFLKSFGADVLPDQQRPLLPILMPPPPPRSILYNKPLFSLDAKKKLPPLRSTGRGVSLNPA
jgi:MFS family permease